MQFFDDFIMAGNATALASGAAFNGSLGQWSTYFYQGGAITDGALEGGVILLASDGDNEGVAMTSTAGAFRITTTSTLLYNQPLWFECRVA